MTLSGSAWPAVVAQAILKRAPLPLRLKMRIKESLFPPADPRSNRETGYSNWIARNDTLSDHDRSLIRGHIASFQDKPKFSILMPVYNTPDEYLRQAIDSVVEQLYQDWELC